MFAHSGIVVCRVVSCRVVDYLGLFMDLEVQDTALKQERERDMPSLSENFLRISDSHKLLPSCSASELASNPNTSYPGSKFGEYIDVIALGKFFITLVLLLIQIGSKNNFYSLSSFEGF